jgi:uncharacterized repeat protein (TIGR04138 family)
MQSTASRLKYHPNAYQFIFAALRHTQQILGKQMNPEQLTADAHISGPQLLEGIRQLGLQEFGLMTRTVFNGWGVHNTEDFGRIVFELVERGEMRKTEHDHIHDFVDVYEFDTALDGTYQIDCSSAFRP